MTVIRKEQGTGRRKSCPSEWSSADEKVCYVGSSALLALYLPGVCSMHQTYFVKVAAVLTNRSQYSARQVLVLTF
jgi:hypothetical protein